MRRYAQWSFSKGTRFTFSEEKGLIVLNIEMRIISLGFEPLIMVMGSAPFH